MIDVHEGAPIGTLQLESRSAGPKERAKCEEPFAPLLLRVMVFFLDDGKPAMFGDERTATKAFSLAGTLPYGFDEELP